MNNVKTAVGLNQIGRTWEDIHVISLASIKGLLFVLDRVERGARGKDNLAIRPFDCTLELNLGQPDRVGQRENNRSWIQLGHASDHSRVEGILREHVSDRISKPRGTPKYLDGGETKQCSGLHIVDHINELLDWWTGIVLAREI